jgi:hypothetical protein
MLEGDLKKMKRGLERVPQATFRAVERAFQQSGQEFQRQVTLNRFRPFTENRNTTSIMQSRTGFLKKSIGYKVSGSSFSDLELRVFSAGIKYANLQEYGGTIRPVNRKYLAIPIAGALGRRGIPKKSSPLDYPNGFFFKSSRGNLLFGQMVGKGKRKKLELLYSLRKSVKIPPRFGFRKTWTELGGNRIKRIRAAFQDGMRQAFGGSI